MLDLSRPRDAGSLIGDSYGIYFRHFGRFVAISAAVVVPVQLIVSGLGLEQLFSDYDSTPDTAQLALPSLVTLLVITPLVAGMTIHALLEAAEGRKPQVRRSIMTGLDAFTPVFAAVLLAALALLAAVLPGALIAPGSVALGAVVAIACVAYVGVRLYFVMQTAVIERRRGTGALRRSWELVAGAWWRVFGTSILIALVSILPAQLLAAPLEAAAAATDASALSLLGTMLAQVLGEPLLIIGTTLLYFDVSARRAGRTPPPVPPPPPSSTPPDPPGLPPRGD